MRVVVFFSESLAELDVGSPVTFHGVHIGLVQSIAIRFSPDTMTARIPVYLEIQLDRLILEGETSGDTAPDYERLIRAGVRAQVVLQSFVTGQLRVDLDFLPGTPAQLVGAAPGVPEIPAVRSDLGQLRKQLTELRRQRSTPTARPEDRRHRRPRLQRSSPDLGSVRQIHAKHPDMVLLHGGSPKGAELIAAKWATNRKVPQIAFKPDWTKHANAAPFKAQRRDATMCCRSASWCSPAPASRTISPTRPERSAFRSGGSAPAARERQHLHSESGRSLLRSRAPAARSAQ
jgi:hypothetical protein